MSLDIPEEFYPEIAANEEQRKEWVKLFAIDEIEGDLVTRGYSEPLTVEFLRENKNLFVSTKHFPRDFCDKVLSILHELDKEMGGLLINGDNRHALTLITRRFYESISCIHIDPPYNTDTSGFLYKNNYRHSSWLTMMFERLNLSGSLLATEGALLCHIDENEYERLHALLSEMPIADAGTVVWDKRNPMNAGSGVALQHEYIIWRSNTSQVIYGKSATEEIIAKASELINKAEGVTPEVKAEFATWINNNPNLSGGEKAYKYLDDEGNVFQSVSLRAPEPRTDPKFHKPLLHPKTGKPCAVPPNGFSRTPETLQGMVDRNEILFGEDESNQPRQKVVLTPDKRRQVTSVIADAKKGKADLDVLGLEFPYCHPTSLYDALLEAACPIDGIVCDFFAGSGTSGHSVINLNKTDQGYRKYILIEVASHFDGVLLPRILKVSYSASWRKARPLVRSNSCSQIIKSIRLESYEDALNNLEARRSQSAQLTFDSPKAQGEGGFKEQYMLRYMLDVETKGSQSLLNIKDFLDPTAYQMKIKRPGTDESKVVNVDLLETFNWLLGLTVDHIAAPQSFSTSFGRDDEKRLILSSQLKQKDDGAWWFRTVTGKDPDGRSVLVIWRKRPGGDAPEGIEQDNLVLNEWFRKLGFSTRDREFDLVYVNGTNNLENARIDGENWKVRLIEQDFMRLMFDVEEV